MNLPNSITPPPPPPLQSPAPAYSLPHPLSSSHTNTDTHACDCAFECTCALDPPAALFVDMPLLQSQVTGAVDPSASENYARSCAEWDEGVDMWKAGWIAIEEFDWNANGADSPRGTRDEEVAEKGDCGVGGAIWSVASLEHAEEDDTSSTDTAHRVKDSQATAIYPAPLAFSEGGSANVRMEGVEGALPAAEDTANALRNMIINKKNDSQQLNLLVPGEVNSAIRTNLALTSPGEDGKGSNSAQSPLSKLASKDAPMLAPERASHTVEAHGQAKAVEVQMVEDFGRMKIGSAEPPHAGESESREDMPQQAVTNQTKLSATHSSGGNKENPLLHFRKSRLSSTDRSVVAEVDHKHDSIIAAAQVTSAPATASMEVLFIPPTADVVHLVDSGPETGVKITNEEDSNPLKQSFTTKHQIYSGSEDDGKVRVKKKAKKSRFKIAYASKDDLAQDDISGTIPQGPKHETKISQQLRQTLSTNSKSAASHMTKASVIKEELRLSQASLPLQTDNLAQTLGSYASYIRPPIDATDYDLQDYFTDTTPPTTAHAPTLGSTVRVPRNSVSSRELTSLASSFTPGMHLPHPLYHHAQPKRVRKSTHSSTSFANLDDESIVDEEDILEVGVDHEPAPAVVKKRAASNPRKPPVAKKPKIETVKAKPTRKKAKKAPIEDDESDYAHDQDQDRDESENEKDEPSTIKPTPSTKQKKITASSLLNRGQVNTSNPSITSSTGSPAKNKYGFAASPRAKPKRRTLKTQPADVSESTTVGTGNTAGDGDDRRTTRRASEREEEIRKKVEREENIGLRLRSKDRDGGC